METEERKEEIEREYSTSALQNDIRIRQPEHVSYSVYGVPPSRFALRPHETACALMSYVMAYAYVGATPAGWIVTALLFTAITEYINFGKKTFRKETILWLSAFLLLTAGLCMVESGVTMCFHVWDRDQLYMLVHVFAVWYAVSRGGALLENKSGTMLPADVLAAFVRIPFENFFLRIRVLRGAAGELIRKQKEGKRCINLWIPAATVICLILFIQAAMLLGEADDSFGDVMTKLESMFSHDWDVYGFADFMIRLVISFPVGMYLYGLIAGAARTERSILNEKRIYIVERLAGIRRVPAIFWTIVIGFFSLMYVIFYVMQGSYLFGAFSRTLPEGYIVSEYARKGFFELCKVVAVNFTLLMFATWMVTRDTAETRSFRIACAALLAESMLFAVIAFSKLALYISCFGLTPLRLQSSWLVCMLFAGCVLWEINLFTGKKLFRPWLYLCAVTLILLALY